MRTSLAILSLVLAVVTSACSGDSGEQQVADSSPQTTVVATTTVAATTTSAAPTTTVAGTTTTIAETTTTTSVIEVGEGYVKESDLVYMTVDGYDYLMDVYTPDSEGPWPVAVVFHGIDSEGKNGPDQTVIAKRAAAQGILVFVPSWLGDSFRLNLETWLRWKDVTGCAVAFAQEQAVGRGGDPANTVLHGFSAGVGGPLWAALSPIEAPILGCLAGTPSMPPTGLVLGDGNYLLFDRNWDQVFTDDTEAMQAELDALVDPARWPADLNAKVYLWVAGNGAPPPRQFDSEWFDLRDPDGSIRADLEALGQLEDGTVSTTDAGHLLAFRMEQAGLDVTLDELPGGHQVLGKSEELVGYIEAAASG